MNPNTIVKPYQEKVFQQDNLYCVYDGSLVKNFSPEMLNSLHWLRQNAVEGTALGRGTTWFIHHQGNHWVLRHYFRGGMIGKFNRDRYLFHSLASTRAAREFSLLNILQQHKLPAPRPVAYRVIRHGAFYQADLLTVRIENANDLVAVLSQRSISDTLWNKIGSTIKRFHDNGIYHHDLNAHNILIDDKEDVWLIDFDRGEQRSISSSWQQSNLSRLHRSFNKETKKIADFHWQESHWQSLMSGYQD